MGDIIPIRTAIANCYLVRGERPYLVDTNTPRGKAKISRAISQAGLKPSEISYILITHYHFDHTGSLAELKKETGAKVAAGAEDVPFIEGREPMPVASDLTRMGRIARKMPQALFKYQRFRPCEVDISLKDGESLEDLGLEIIALPGHTPGGIAFVDRDKNLAFIGDLVSNYLGRPGYPYLMYSQSLQQIQQSIRRLAQLDLDFLYPGHGKIIGPRASQILEDFLKKKGL